MSDPPSSSIQPPDTEETTMSTMFSRAFVSASASSFWMSSSSTTEPKQSQSSRKTRNNSHSKPSERLCDSVAGAIVDSITTMNSNNKNKPKSLLVLSSKRSSSTKSLNKTSSSTKRLQDMMILQDRSPNWTTQQNQAPPDSGIQKGRSPPPKTPGTLMAPQIHRDNQDVKDDDGDDEDDNDDEEGNMDGSPVLQTISRYGYDTPPRAPTFSTSKNSSTNQNNTSMTNVGNAPSLLYRSKEESSMSFWMNWAEDIMTTQDVDRQPPQEAPTDEPSISVEHFEQLEIEQEQGNTDKQTNIQALALLSSPAPEDEEMHVFQDNDESKDDESIPPPPPPLGESVDKEEEASNQGITLDGLPLDVSSDVNQFNVYGEEYRETSTHSASPEVVVRKLAVESVVDDVVNDSTLENANNKNQDNSPSWETKITIDNNQENDNISLELVPTDETSLTSNDDDNEAEVDDLVPEKELSESQLLRQALELPKKEDPPTCREDEENSGEGHGITLDGEPLDASVSEASIFREDEREIKPLEPASLNNVSSSDRVQKVPLEPEEEYSEYDSINTSVAMNITEADISAEVAQKQGLPDTSSMLDVQSKLKDDKEFEKEHLDESFPDMPQSSSSTIKDQESVSSEPTSTTDTEGGENMVVDNTPSKDNPSEVAMTLCNVAWRLFKDGEHEEALNTYKHAVEHCKTQLRQGSVLAAVNAAGCYRNMSTVSRKMNQYDQAATFMKKAEQLYVAAREGVAVDSAVNTFEGVPEESVNGTEEFLYLDALILETLNFRANFHVQFLDNIQQAIECHEQCLKQLLHLQKLRQWDNVAENLIRLEGVTYAPLSKDQHTEMLVNSLKALGGYYRRAPDSSADTLVIFEDALSVLQQYLEHEEPENDRLIDSVSKILRDFSEILFHRQELDRSVESLYYSVCVKLTRSGKPCSESLLTLDKMGHANEKMENYDKALECYEQALMARCKFYGNTHPCVAKSLVNIARVTELRDGNTDEVVELYRAANAIYAVQIASPEKDLDEDCDAILRMIPTVIRQGRYEKVINDLKMVLTVAEEDKNNENFGVSLDRAQIYFDLGRAYLGMGDYVEASACLVEAMKEAGNVTDIDVLSLLHRAENVNHDKDERTDTVNSSYHSSQDSDYVPSVAGNKTVSFHESVLLPHTSDRSLQIFEDVSQGDGRDSGKINCEDRYDGPEEENYPDVDPRHSILYESFAREPSFILEPSFQYRCSSSSKCWRQKAKLLSSDLAKKIKDKVKRLHKPRANPETTKKARIRRKLNKLRKKCIKQVRSMKRNTISPEDKPAVPRQDMKIMNPADDNCPAPIWETMILELTDQSFATDSSKHFRTRAVIIRQEMDVVEVENCDS